MALDNFHAIHTDYPQQHSIKALTCKVQIAEEKVDFVLDLLQPCSA
jgi:hypothetical protein